jgi:hypothetical protein
VAKDNEGEHMTFWDRITAAIHNGAHGSASDINQVEIHYEGETVAPHIIQGGDESYDFLAAYSTFDEVQAALALPGMIDHISCVNMLDEFNMRHYGLEHPDTDRGTIEEFYRNGLSMLEQEAAGGIANETYTVGGMK